MSSLPWARPVQRTARTSRPPVGGRVGALVAAARQISAHRMRGRGAYESWQVEAWDLYEQVGELRYVSQVQADTVSRVTTFPARWDADGDEPERVYDGPAAEVFGLLGDADARATIIRDLALHVLVAGAGYLVGLPPEREGDAAQIGPLVDDVRLGDLTWHVRSVEDVQHRAGKVSVLLDDGRRREVPHDDVWLVKVWRPHPRRADQADSAVRSVLPVLREIVALTQHVSAQVDSRLAGAGLLLVPDSIQTQGQSDQPDDGTDGRDDDFIGALIESMVTPIRDRDVASAVVPLVASVPDEAIDKVQHLKFSTPLDDVALQLREEAIRRLALGLDAPPEVLLGMSTGNHWSAWAIEESRIRVQIEPLAALICQALTDDVFRPALEAAGVPEPHRYALWWDTATLLLRPNRAQDAQALHDRGELSGEALRREAGFDESDAPDETVDRAVEIALKMVQDSPGLIVDPGLPAILEVLRDTIGGAASGGGAGGPVSPSGVEMPEGP